MSLLEVTALRVALALLSRTIRSKYLPDHDGIYAYERSVAAAKHTLECVEALELALIDLDLARHDEL